MSRVQIFVSAYTIARSCMPLKSSTESRRAKSLVHVFYFSMSDSECETDWLAELGGGGANAEAIVRVADASALGLRLASPRNRSVIESHYWAARMREAKARLRQERFRKVTVSKLSSAIEHVNKTGLSKANNSLAPRLRRGLVLVIKRVGWRGSARAARRGMTFAHMLRMGFDPIVSASNLARSYRVDARWATRVRHAVAHAVVCGHQLTMSRAIESIVRAPPVVFVVSLSFDETQQKLSLQLPGVSECKRGAWHVLNAQSHFNWAGKTTEGTWRSAAMDFVRPPVPVLGTSAPCLAHAQWEVPSAEPYTMNEQRGLATARIAMVNFDRDGAGSNDKVLEYRKQLLPASTLVSDRTCFNHANSLVEGSVCAAVDLKVITTMYSISQMFRMGATFLRLHHSVHQFVDALKIVRGEPPPEAHAYGLELMHYARVHFRHSRKSRRRRNSSHDSSDDEGSLVAQQASAAEQKYMDAWAEFLHVANGFLWLPAMHFCASWQCCQGFDSSIARTRLKDAILSLLFATLPAIPVKGKWTKTGPSVDWYVFSLGTGHILQSA